MQTYIVYVKWKLPDDTYLVRGIGCTADNSDQAEKNVMRRYTDKTRVKELGLGRPILIEGETDIYSDENVPRLKAKLNILGQK